MVPITRNSQVKRAAVYPVWESTAGRFSVPWNSSTRFRRANSISVLVAGPLWRRKRYRINARKLTAQTTGLSEVGGFQVSLLTLTKWMGIACPYCV